MSLENDFLKYLVDEEIPVTIFLVNGVKLQGIIAGFDDGVIFLQRHDDGGIRTNMVYRHAGSTVMPNSPMQFPPAGAKF